MSRVTFMRQSAGLLAFTLIVTACGGGGEDAGPTMPAAEEAATPEQMPAAAESMPQATLAPSVIRIADVGFATPESVLHDTGADVYLVSNVNGAPTEKDGNGFISRVSPDGQVLDLKWIDGTAAGVTLNAPKGLAIDGGRLYVADIDCIRIFDESTGAPAGEVCVEGASFLNDVGTARGGGVLFTDSGLDATGSKATALRPWSRVRISGRRTASSTPLTASS
jgi:hypothetical protein